MPDDAIMVTRDPQLPVGSTAHVWLADGTPAALRVIGELPVGSPSDALVGAGNAFSDLSAPTPPSTASRTGLFVVLGIVLGYTALSLVNTLLMTAPDRAGERRALRLLGALRSQVRRIALLEVLVAVAVGIALAAPCALVAVGGLWLTRLRVTGPLPIAVPWAELGAITAGTITLAALCSLADTRR
ncbi:FtsX-like permease family protein [Dactylosporangium sp. CA-139114]|uniref:FtsX-like permease family protein n=1 Tax=Dactylosporangium sp. CA-139114 TaxID=3239931 RepID=UPI003D95B87C